MSRITIENASVTLTTVASTLPDLFQGEETYTFPFVTNITIADPTENGMTVSPQGGSNGLSFRLNTTSPVAIEMIVRDLPTELLTVLRQAHGENRNRVDFMILDTNTEERFDLNDCLITSNPSNTAVSEGEESLDVGVTAVCAPKNFSHSGY
jgi:hypothetical protein